MNCKNVMFLEIPIVIEKEYTGFFKCFSSRTSHYFTLFAVMSLGSSTTVEDSKTNITTTKNVHFFFQRVHFPLKG